VAARKYPRGSHRYQAASWLSGLALDLLDLPAACARDGDAPRLHGLGNLALKLDDQQTILEASALDLDVVGQGELALEVAGRDAAMQESPLFLVALAALERQYVLLDRQIDLVRLETGERDGNLEAVLVEAFDVVGG